MTVLDPGPERGQTCQSQNPAVIRARQLAERTAKAAEAPAPEPVVHHVFASDQFSGKDKTP